MDISGKLESVKTDMNDRYERWLNRTFSRRNIPKVRSFIYYCPRIVCTILFILLLSILYASGTCGRLTEFHVTKSITSFLGLKKIIIINKTPHGEIKLSAINSGLGGQETLQINSNNYAVSDINRNLLTTTQLLNSTVFKMGVGN